METHKGKSVAVVKEFQMEGSWAPVTPLKPTLPGPRPIYEDGQRGFLGQAFMKESEDYLAKFSQPAEGNTPNIHQNHSHGINIWGIDDGIYLQRENVKSQSQDTRTMSSFGSSSSYPSFSSWDKQLPWQNNGQNSTYLSTGFENMSFGELLAINGSAVEPSLISERPGDSSDWNSHPENSMLNSSAVFRSQQGLPQLNQQFHGIYGQVISNSADSHQGWSLSNVNSSPRTMHINGENFTFAPSTPDSRWKADSVVASGNTNLGTQQKPNEQNGLQEHEVASAMVDLQGLNNNEVTGLTTDSSPGKVSIAVDENHNPDKGDSHDIDLNKTPQKKPRRKRYLPKVVKENKPKRTPKPKTPKPTEVKDAPRTKRKYVRKNKAETPSNSPAGEADTINSKPTKTASKSCRRSLSFNLDGQDNSLDKSNGALDTDSQTIDHHPAVNQSGHTVNPRQGEDLVTETSQVGVAYDLNHTLNQELKTHIGLPQQGNKEVSHPDQTILTKVTEKATGNLLGNNAEESSRTYPTQSPNSSPCASSNEGVQRRGSKRVFSSITDTVNVNAGSVATNHGTYCAPNHIFLHNSDAHGVPNFLFSEIHKKKRTNKGQKSHESSTSSAVTASQDKAAGSENHPRVDPTASKYYQCIPAPSGTSTVTSNQLEMLMRCAENRVQLMNTWLDISRLNKKKRSKGTIRNRNLDPLQGTASVSPSKSTGKSTRRRKSDISSTHYPGDSSYNDQPNCGYSCTNALSEDTNETPRLKRRYKKQNSVINSNSGVKKGWAVVVYNGNQPVWNTSGSIPMPPLIKTLSLEAITEGLKQLDINRDQNALVPYHANKQEQNALVLYKNDGTLVPFEGPFNPVKKRQQRAKVDLDDETSRVWRLLLENIDNEGIDGTDEEKVKWWENERSVFHGRVDSFIARMRLVQGDRRFTPWKGSVLDSVIGVFLTQNVSDHLSSSAFMAMAARFPIKSESCESVLSEETSAVIVEPEVCIIQPEERITWNEKLMDQPVCARNSRIIHEIVHTEEKEDVNSQVRVRVVPGPFSPVDCSSESSLKATSEPRLNKENSHTTETEAASTQGDDRARDDATSPQQSMISSQNSVNSPMQPDGIMRTFSESNSRAQGLASSSQCYYFDCSTSFLGLLKMAESPLLRDSYSQIHGYDPAEYMKHVAKNSIEAPDIYSGDHQLHKQLDIHLKETTSIEMVEVESKSSDTFRKDENSTPEQSNLTTGSSVLPFVEEKNSISRSSPENMCCYVLEGEKMVMHTQTESRKDSPENVTSSAQGQTSSFWKSPNLPNSSPETADVTESTITLDRTNNDHKEVVQISENNYEPGGISDIANANPTKSKRQRAEKDKRNAYDWDNLRKQAQANGRKKERPSNTRDSLDWEAVRRADVSEIADTIKERGMNNVLAGRIKDLLDKLVKDHGSTDLEWLRDVPPDKAKEYLLSFRGLGLKSVECVRLLTLHHLAFPVDTNVGRIAVRLGWVPLQPLPESVQLHLLELYPVLESIQKYLWPRLCKLDQKTLYELHYHLITFGKVFCTKRQPNCNACPLRGECRHFASAFASARLALPGPEKRSIMASSRDSSTHIDPHNNIKPLPLPPSQNNDLTETNFGCNKDAPIIEVPSTPLSLSLMQPTHHLERKSQVNCEPIVEVPASPEPEPEQEQTLCDIEDNFYEDPDEIPTIELNMEKFTQTLQNVMHANRELQESGMSRALVALTPEAASIPTPKLKNISRLRTEHHVYELPDTHPLLKELDKREPDDPCSYLLAIWTPGETANTILPPDRRCSSDDPSILCNEETCSYCSSQREANTQIVRGTLLIPCRTAMRGSFPLNGTYFQVNEVFADHDSSLNPINVPRSWLWNLPRRTVYFGTSVPTIFKGLTTEEIQHCFWRGYVCVRGFDQKTRAPRPLMARLHFPASKMPRGAKGKADDEQVIMH